DHLISREAGNAVAAPYYAFPPLVRRVILAVGVLGALVLVVRLLFAIAPAFNRLFERFTAWYEGTLRLCLHFRTAVVVAICAGVLVGFLCYTHIGQELFPEVDSSDFTLHLRAAGGPRVETTEEKVREIEKIIRETVPADDLEMTLANMGI